MTTFPTVRSEGGLLPADLLARIAGLDDDLGGLDPADFGLPPETRVAEAIAQAWPDAQRHWQSFAAKVARGRADTTATRELWLFQLLELLGWDRPSYRATAETVGDRRYPVSHRASDADGPGSPPLHLVAWDEELEQAKGSAASPGRSPHGLMQEYLNRTDHLWGIVSNGRRLRLLRDNQSLSRAAYVEADLEGMLNGGVYADFRLLWLLAHRSRFPGPTTDPDHCPLERWRVAAEERGARALNDLRGGVEQAIEALGQGFLDHPANRADPARPDALGSRLADGRLQPAAYYRQLLRLVYRLIFLFVAEERNLLFPEETDPAARAPYDRCYSATRLRDLVGRRRGRDRHDDLWRGLRQTFAALAGEDEAAPPSPLGLRPLGGLFEPGTCPDLDRAMLGNAPLLDAVRALSLVADSDDVRRRVNHRDRDGVLRRVNYRDLDVEELGSVYESLLELQPTLAGEGGRRVFALGHSGERKSTGSYYTNPGLVQELVRSALDPVIAAAVERGKTPAEQRANLLALAVCDPACGSGHFLLAAARRIGRRVAEIDAGGGEPTPEAERRAIRAAIGCVHGVDLNELAVDLCKVALWLEGHDPGKPMGFLDARIRHGNGLIGATEAAMAEGIPDAAFEPVAGDDKKFAAGVKKRNRAERKGQRSIEGLGWTVTPLSTPEAVARYFATMHAPDDNLAAVREKRRAHHRATHAPAAVRDELVADLWTAAFFWPLREGEAPPPTEGTWRRLAASPRLTDFVDQRTATGLAESADGRTVRQARALRRRHRFLHWHLAFPEVFARADPGFDCVLANPPWERVKLQEQEFFAQRDPEIAAAPNAAARKRLIAALPSSADPAKRALHRAYEEALGDAENTSGFLRGSGRYPLTGRGDVNLYSVFAETLTGVVSPRGQAGVIVPTGIATDDTNKHFFGWLVDAGRLRALYDFENRKGIFEGVHRSYKFSLLTVAGSGRPDRAFEAAFFLLDPAEVREAGRAFTLTADDIALLNPNTRTCPVFRSRRDAEITTAVYRAAPVLVREGPPEANPWGVTFKRMFDMSNDSHLFRTHAQLTEAGLTLQADGRFHGRGQVWLPLYEAKMIHQYDHRFATYNLAGDATRDLTDREHADPACLPLPRYWVEEAEVERAAGGKRGWFLGFRDIARNTDIRTGIFSCVPWAAVGHNLPLLTPTSSASQSAALMANLNSAAFDYVTRQKAGGTHMTFFIVKQLPVLPPETYTPSLLALIVPRVLELTYTAWDLQPFARDLGHDGPPFGWDPERRARLRADLDGVYAHLYGLSRDDFDYVLGTFPIVNRNDQKQFGEERTRRLCLEAWDRFSEDALLTLRREIDAVELKLRRLVARTLGPGLDRVPETTRARMLEVLAQRHAAAGQRGPVATAATTPLAEALEAATIVNLGRILTAPANRAAFVAPFPDHHELDERITDLNTLRNLLNHGERWPADRVRTEGEAAIEWFRARMGG